MLQDVLQRLLGSKPRRKCTPGRRPTPLSLEVLEKRDYFAGVQISPVRGLNTSEEGGAAVISMRLTEQPAGNVTIPLSSSDTGEGVVSVSQVVFTPDNFNLFQKVRVTGVPDGVKDGNQVYQLITGDTVSDDPTYNGLAVPDATLTNKDSRKILAGVTVKKTSGLKTTEEGGTAAFTVKLNFRPTADVTIAIASDNPIEGVANVTE